MARRREQTIIANPTIRNAKASDFADRAKLQDLDKTTDEDKIVDLVYAMIDEAESSDNFQNFQTQFKEAYQFYHGDQWLDENLDPLRAPSYRFRTIRDICFSTIELIRPLISDARPTIYYVADNPDRTIEEMKLYAELGLLPENPELQPFMSNIETMRTDDEIAQDATAIIQAEHEHREEEVHLSTVLGDMAIGGLGVRKVYWDWKNRRLGVKQFCPTDVLIDPYCHDHDLQDAKYVILRKEMDLEELQIQYNLTNQTVRDIQAETFHSEDQNYGLFRSRNLSPFPASNRHRNLIRNRINVYEVWFFGQLPFEFENEGYSKVIKHPFGRVFIVAGKKVIRDPIPNPFEHGMLPLVFFRNYTVSTGKIHAPYAFGDIYPLKQNQVSMNVLLSQIIMNAILMANAQWVVEQGAVPDGWLTNEPGLIIETARGQSGGIRKEPGAPMPGYVTELMMLIEQHAKSVSRVNDTVAGISPGSHASGIAINQLQNAALGSIRQKSRFLDSAYKKQGYLELRLLQQFALSGAREIVAPYERGDMDLGEWRRWTERISTLEMDVRIESKAELPSNILDRLVFAQQQVMTGIFDPIEAIEFAKIPISDRLKHNMEIADELKRIQAEVVIAQAQAQLGQMQAPQQEGNPMMAGAESAPPQGRPPMEGTAEQVAVGFPPQSNLVAATQGAATAAV